MKRMKLGKYIADIPRINYECPVTLKIISGKVTLARKGVHVFGNILSPLKNESLQLFSYLPILPVRHFK